MNSFIVILSCLAAVAFANPAPDSEEILVEFLANGQRICRLNNQPIRPQQPNWNPWNPWNPPVNPIVDCPPESDGTCFAPDCDAPGNEELHFDHPDPNYFIQCQPREGGGREAVVRPCACGTVFSSAISRRHCCFPHQWRPACPEHPNEPELTRDHCDDNVDGGGNACPNCSDNDDNGNGLQNNWNQPWQQPPRPIQPWQPSPPQVQPWQPSPPQIQPWQPSPPQNQPWQPSPPQNQPWQPSPPQIQPWQPWQQPPQQNQPWQQLPQQNQPWQQPPQQNQPWQQPPQQNQPWQQLPQQNQPWQQLPQQNQPRW